MIRLLMLATCILTTVTASAQWDVFLSSTMKNTAKLHSTGNVLFHYDDVLRRSVDGGATWTTIEAVPHTITAMANVGFATVAAIMDDAMKSTRIITSTDAGLTWTETGTITFTNIGFVHELVFDGSVIYAVSNRDEVFISLDLGGQWIRFAYVSGGASSALDGTLHSSGMWVLSTSGLYYTANVGITWTKQGANEALPAAPQQIEVVNDDLFLLTLSGVHRWNTTTQKWEDMSETLPDFATLKARLRDIRGDGSTIYAVGQLFDGSSFVVTSTDRGTTWTTYGEPLPNSSGVTRRAMALTSEYLVVFHNGVGAAAAANGYYRMTRPTTSVDSAEPIREGTQVFPQPASDIVTVRMSESNSGHDKFTVYDVHGRMVRTVTAAGGEVRFSVADLPAGIYTVSSMAARQTAVVYVVR